MSELGNVDIQEIGVSMANGGGLPPPATTAEDVLAGLDWAVGENARAESELYGKIDTDKVAAAGHSCGGLQAIELAADPRIDTVLIHNSGIYNSENSPIGQPMGGAVAHVAVDWLKWQLRGDEVAGRTFLGENCRLCARTEWTLERKGW